MYRLLCFLVQIPMRNYLVEYFSLPIRILPRLHPLLPLSPPVGLFLQQSWSELMREHIACIGGNTSVDIEVSTLMECSSQWPRIVCRHRLDGLEDISTDFLLVPIATVRHNNTCNSYFDPSKLEFASLVLKILRYV